MADSGCPGPVLWRGAPIPARPWVPRYGRRDRRAVPITGIAPRSGLEMLGGAQRSLRDKGRGHWLATIRRALGLTVVLLGTSFRLAAAEQTEAGAFRVAADEYTAGYWKQAEADFAEFARKYPESTNLPNAFLCQAVARYHQTNYVGTIDLLSSHQGQAGKWAEAYSFWQAKAWQAKGDGATAAEAFGKLIQQFPGSPLCLEAAVEEARARAGLGDWGRVIELLQKPEGTFQTAVRTNATAEAIAGGWLLLGEAQFARRDYLGAEAAIQPLARLAQDVKRLSPEAAWQWHYLVSRLRVAQGRLEEALANSTNLLAAAAATADPAQQAESYAFVGELWERLGRAEEAVNAYTNNLAGGIPPERQTQALQRVTELLISSNQLAQAAVRLEDFAVRLPDAPPTPVALLLLGELRLRQQAVEPVPWRPVNPSTNAPSATNYLAKASTAFSQLLTNRFASSSLLGRAELGLGWCSWLQEDWPKCETACQAAVEQLPRSPDQAVAQFKLADALFKQDKYRAAITQYNAILDRYRDLPQVSSNLFEPALYQSARAALAGGFLSDATNALGRILSAYPNGFRADRVMLLAGQGISRRGGQGDPEEARRMFAEAAQRWPDSALAPQFALAVARTYEQENQLAKAIGEYRQWIERFPTNSARPQAEYYLAINQFLAGNLTNALGLMTNLVAHYPTDPVTPLAQWWLGDYYYRTDNQYLKAELIYQAIYKNTNLPPSDLTYQAQMMAGRAAMRRQGWPEAINHFTNLTSDAKCPAPIWAEAMFAYGDTLVSQESTNKADDYGTASQVFNRIVKEQPTNRLSAAALGAKANCYWQLAQQKGQLDQLTNAAQAFQEAIAFPGVDVRVRSMAEVGWGAVIEKQARQKSDPERQTLLNQALDKYLHVLFRKNLAGDEQPDPFWLKKAGLEAARLAEESGQWHLAIEVYQRLEKLLPPLTPSLELKILNARASEKARKS